MKHKKYNREPEITSSQFLGSENLTDEEYKNKIKNYFNDPKYFIIAIKHIDKITKISYEIELIKRIIVTSTRDDKGDLKILNVEEDIETSKFKKIINKIANDPKMIVAGTRHGEHNKDLIHEIDHIREAITTYHFTQERSHPN